MGTAAEEARQKVPVCLVEYNPLAARQLHRILESDPAVRSLSQDDVLKSKRVAKSLVSVFVLDRGTLPAPLSKYLRFLRFRFPQAKVVVLDQPRGKEELVRLLFLGMQGFLAYRDVEAQLREAIRTVADGDLWVTPEVLEEYLRYSAGLSSFKAKSIHTLSRREQRILDLTRRRLCNKEIGSILGISETSVALHLSNIFAKLGVRDRNAVAEAAHSRPLGKLLLQKLK